MRVRVLLVFQVLSQLKLVLLVSLDLGPDHPTALQVTRSDELLKAIELATNVPDLDLVVLPALDVLQKLDLEARLE